MRASIFQTNPESVPVTTPLSSPLATIPGQTPQSGPLTVPRSSLGGSTWLLALIGVVCGVLLGWLPFPANLLLIAAVIVAVLAIAAPPYALAALLLSVALNNVGTVTLGGVHVTFAQAFTLAALLGWMLRALSLQRGRIRATPIALAYAAYVAVAAISIVVADDLRAWGDTLYVWGAGGLILLMAVDSIRTTRDARPVVIAIALGTIAVSLYSFYQVQGGVGPVSFRVGGVVRGYGTFGQPNSFAKYLELSVPVLAAVAGSWTVERLPFGAPLRPFGRGPLASTPLAVVSGLGAVLGTLALVLTQSRGGWIGGALALLVVAWLLGGAFRWAMLGAGVILALALIVTPLGELAALRLGPEALGLSEWSDPVDVTTANWGTQERLAHWRAGVTMAVEHPVLGVGAGNFDDHFRESTPNWRFRIPRGHAHNAYIHVAAETGLVGLAAYFALVGTVATRLAVLWKRAMPAARPLVIGAIGVSIAVASHNMFDYLHVNTFPVQLTIVWALAEVSGAVRSGPPQESYGMVSS